MAVAKHPFVLLKYVCRDTQKPFSLANGELSKSLSSYMYIIEHEKYEDEEKYQ